MRETSPTVCGIDTRALAFVLTAALTSLGAAPLAAQEIIDSTGLPGPTIDDETTHTYSVGASGIGTFADHTITRVFAAPIDEITVTIVDGRADDIGYVGSLLVTNIVPQCSDVSTVVAPVDVTSEVTVDGNEATLTLRAEENCCCVTGWGSATQGDRADARLHWEVTIGEAEEYEVSFTSFIPAPFVLGPRFATCNGDFGRQRLYFDGDGRSFSEEAGSYRTRQKFTLVTDEEVDEDGIVGTVQNLVGTTKSYAEDALAGTELMEDELLNDCHLLHDEATAGNGDMSVVSLAPVSDGTVRVRLRGGPGNPLVRPHCDIDWNLVLEIHDDGETTTYSLTGSHDGFPAYEMYVNGTAIYTYDPAAAGRGLSALCIGGNARVSESGSLP